MKTVIVGMSKTLGTKLGQYLVTQPFGRDHSYITANPFRTQVGENLNSNSDEAALSEFLSTVRSLSERLSSAAPSWADIISPPSPYKLSNLRDRDGDLNVSKDPRFTWASTR